MPSTVANKTEAYYRKILREVFSERIEKNPRYSLRSFARSLGMDSGAVSQILNGTRIPSEKAAKKIASRLSLSPEQEHGFYASLSQVHRSRNLRRVRGFFKSFPAASRGETRDLSLELFRTISDWYHYAILQLTLTEAFRSDPRWIASQLGLTVSEVNLAIDRLKRLEFLAEKNGRLTKVVPPLRTARPEMTTSAHRKRQAQILQKAITALDEVPIELRNQSAMTMAIDPQKIPEARRRISQFLEDLSNFLESGSKTHVYEATVSLFPLQRIERTPTP